MENQWRYLLHIAVLSTLIPVALFQANACNDDQFRCSTGFCIPNAWVCDGDNDCGNLMDEQDCPERTCEEDDFTCNNGHCVPEIWRCDYDNDCGDQSDERSCDHPACSSSDFRCASGQCIPLEQKCNLIPECADLSDENNCTAGAAACPYPDVQCTNGDCVHFFAWCNVYQDCTDGSDESDQCEYDECSGNQFNCKDNHYCIPSRWVCDDESDCLDGSDEQGCNATFECGPQQWACAGSDHQCISEDKLCNGRSDCPGGVDENPQCNNYNCGLLGCSFQCRNAPYGGICVCDDGYAVGSDNRTCTDFNECNFWGSCEQTCMNSPGSYTCSCVEGYLLEANGHCRATASDPPYVMYAMGNEIIRTNTHGTSFQTIASNINPMDIDYHQAQNKVYWTDPINSKVYRGNFYGGNSNPEEVISLDNIQPEGIAVDWVGENLYFMEKRVGRIEICKLDGSMRGTLIGSGLDNPSSLALDPTEGYMFLSDWPWEGRNVNTDTNPVRIERAYMDGTHRLTLVTDKLYWPNGISVDIPSKRIYWVDGKFDLLESVTYDGQYRQTIVSGATNIPHPHSVAVFESFAYMTDWTRFAVLKTNRFDLTQGVVVVDSSSTNVKPYGIKVVHSSLQPAVSNPCGSDNGGCSHLCVVSHRTDNNGVGYRCMCPFGLQLGNDEATCTAIESFLLVNIRGDFARGVPVNNEQSDAMVPIVIAERDYLYDVDYDAQSGDIFYFVRSYGAPVQYNISRIKRDGTGQETLYSTIIPMVGEISYDWLSKTIYWTDYWGNKISAVKVGDSQTNKTIIDNLLTPRSLSVAPLDGYLFWMDVAVPQKIERSWMDGSHQQVIVSTEMDRGSGLAVDHQTKQIYWNSYSTLQRISRCNFDGTNRVILNVQNLGTPYGIEIFQNYTYFSNTRDTSVYRVNKWTGGGKRLILQEIDTVISVEYYSTELQQGENECSRQDRNGGCSHICFPAPEGQRTCGCPDGMRLRSDQQSCEIDPDYEQPPLCRGWHFQCVNPGTQCIYIWYRCDGNEDCLDGSDEVGCGTDITCSPYVTTCGDGTCLPRDKVCDGTNDCNDGADEEDCPPCSQGSFECPTNHDCLTVDKVCDTVSDCPDGADEQNCEGYSCPDDHFSCEQVQQCLPLRWVCDGNNNCGDNSDEQNCARQNCTALGNQFACRDDGRCIYESWRCDGYSDCDDGSDEDECPPPGSCRENYFRCPATGNCLPTSWICDGDVDCEGGTDEPSSCQAATCSLNQFKCATRNRCIPTSWLCDLDNDCGDGSDEQNCPTQEPRCPEGQWRCPRTTLCIEYELVCNGEDDCPSGDDEGILCNEDFCENANGGCSNDCLQTPHGAQCQCPPGMELNGTKTCIDIDECNPPMYCSQLCTNQRQYYQCSCVEGYTLDWNGQTCKAADGFEAILLMTNRNRIYTKGVDTDAIDLLVSNTDGPSTVTSMAINIEEQSVFWGDASTNKIWKTDINGTNSTEVINSGLDYNELAYDWVQHNLYWSDPYIKIIEVVNVDTLHRATLMSYNITTSITHLAVDPRNGKRFLFWLNRGQNPSVDRLSMDLTERTAIVSTKLYSLNGLTLDLPTDRVYFGDRRMDFIEFVYYNGTGRQQVLVSTQYLRNLGNMVVWENYVYWVDITNQELLRANKLNGQNRSVVVSNLYRPDELVLYHPLLQPAATNPCQNSPCEHLCLLASSPQGYSCVCGAGYKLANNGNACEKVGAFLLYTAKTPWPTILSRKLDPNDESRNDMVQVTGSSDLYDIDFDDRDGYIYWTEARDHEHQNDRALNNIQRIKLNGDNRTAIVPSAFTGSPLTIAIDWVSRNLYWTNPAIETIEVMKLDGDDYYRKVLLSNEGDQGFSDQGQGGRILGDPVALCVDPRQGMLYWADNGDSGVEPHIAKSKMDGSNPEVITADQIDHVDYLIIDTRTQKLYWNDATYQWIVSMNTDASQRTTVVNHVQHGRGLTIWNNYLYYSESGRQRIVRVDKTTGADPVVMVDFVEQNNNAQFRSTMATGLRVYGRDDNTPNACSSGNGGCQHLCLPNGPNTRTCACTTGFQLNGDGTTCSNVTSFAVVSLYYVIRGFDLENFQEAMVPCAGYMRHTLHVEGVMSLGYVYFADYENSGDKRNGIRRVRPDGSGLEDLVMGSGYYGMRGLAIDWIAGNMYFPNVHSSITYLEMSRLDGTKRLVLWQTVDEKPRTMAVNPIKKYLYWADYGVTPSITRARLDASNRTNLVTTGVSIPRDICIDMNTHKVYWVDSVTSNLERMDWDGRSREIIRSDLTNPHGLAIFQSWVYWVDRAEGYIYRASKEPNNNQAPEILKRDISVLRDIAIYDISVQPDAPDNPCKIDNGGCEELCIAMPDGVNPQRQCRCAYGQLADDGTSCEDVPSYLIFARADSIRSLHFDETNYNMPFQPIEGFDLAVALDFAYTTNQIYFTDINADKIMRVTTGSGNPADVITENLSSPEGISVDWIHDRLYWTDQEQDGIFISDFNGENRIQILSADKPRAIIVDPCSGMMYWTDWGSAPKIEKASLAGRSRMTLVDTNVGWPNGLTIDYDERKLYWADGLYQVIERISLNGTRREVILDRASHPFAMTLFGNYIYYTDWDLKAVIRVEKHTGANQVTMWQDTNGPKPMDIHAYHLDKQTQCVESPCLNGNNGGCSEDALCTIASGGAPECSCTEAGKVLANAERVCVADDNQCVSDQFTCASGQCIPSDWRCDLDTDCDDDSDEADNLCYDHLCTTTQFTCANGKCVPSTYVCDFENDCRDNSDEMQNCGFPTCNPQTDFTCPNARCIPMEYLCDGEDDCADGNHTDEQNCPETTCNPGYLKCQNSNTCIFYTWACDGDNDCGDNSDENPLFCRNQECDGFRCDSGACIPSVWVCDEENDCDEGEDETSQTCADRTCPGDYFTCDNGNCIPQSWTCDTDNDCGDNSDENEDVLNCESSTCEADFYTCQQNRPGRTRCIPMLWICDGDSDCEDADDESPEINNCVRQSCQEGFFTCDNGLCIPEDWQCDHDNDCGDSSDENNQCVYAACEDNEFACRNGRCIPAGWRCDGDNDCRDNSDETQCVTVPPTCPPTKHQCNNGQCIDHSVVCNKSPDCDDGSDEERCDINECDELINNQCEFDCMDTTNSYYCTCMQGYTLNEDEKTCRDIDECTEQAGICSQDCENIRGAYFCKCADGYVKEPDGKTCKQDSGIAPSLLFSNKYYIRSLTIDGSDYRLIADGFNNLVALDYDYKEGKIYFSDSQNGNEMIRRINMDGTGLETIFDYHDDIPNVQGLGVDWIARKLYWTDSDKDTIEVSELNGTNRRILHHRGLALPRAVAIDPRVGLLFFTDWGLVPFIGRIGLDGSGFTKLNQIDKLTWPNGLTIYYPVKKIFWIDAHLNYIGYANYDGSGFRELTGTGDIAHPFAVSIFENQVYWTDWNDLAIHAADKWTLANKTILVETLHRPMDIQVYHPYRQNQSIPNPCGTNNGGCSHLCLLKNTENDLPESVSYSCLCPNNFILSRDGKTCRANCSVLQFQCADGRQCIPLQYKCDNEPDCQDGSDETSSCPVRHCDRGQLQCDNLDCTFAQYMCDGENDCSDGTDERRCDQTHCLASEWRCATGSCIQHFQVCDLGNDCPDGSDEDPAVCGARTCSPGYFQCENGYCIPEAWYCDLDDDCGDNSDEVHRQCQSRVTCPPGWLACRSNYRCIPSWAWCDGYDNCRDNSDEDQCDERTCSVGEFKCGNHLCIPQRWTCDHDNDCGDGSDESGCTYRQCSETEWRCPATGRCIRQTWLCDHDDDCGDGTDELACTNHVCLEDLFQCDSGHCIKEEYQCDGDRDCQDMSDEINCGTRIPGGLYCPQHEFTCNNHLCIPQSWVCDGDSDCGDDIGDGTSSDETLAICATVVCDEDEKYHCKNRKCIDRWRLCDGVDNCGDASDENEHDICSPAVDCNEDEFKCTNGNCVLNDMVCDDFDDCSDLSDERGCHKNGGSCSDATCEINCTPIPDSGGYYCSCGAGLNITEDRTGCEDINECARPDTCVQTCLNSKGSYKCICSEGYTDTGSQGLNCKADGPLRQVMFTDGTELRVYDYTNREYSDAIEHEGRIDALDYSKQVIYWVDSALRSVKRAPIPPLGAQAISVNMKISNVNHPQDIAVDWIGGNIYWTDQGDDDFNRRAKRDVEDQGPRITVAKSDGRYVRMLIMEDLDKPSAIAVNPRRGIMYWTDYGATPKIEWAFMDGSNREVLVSDRLQQPTGLSIDFASQDKVYFCDQKASLIEVMNWDGTGRTILLTKDLENPFRLDVFENQIYWTTGSADERGKVKAQDKLGRGIPTIEVRNINLPKGIKIYQEQRYYVDPPVESPCTSAKCSHLCLLIPGKTQNRVTEGYKCVCPDNDNFLSGSSEFCEGAREEPRPLPGACLNGGTADSDGNCKCPSGYSGLTCERLGPGRRTGDGGHLTGGAIAGIFVIIIIVLVAVIALLFYYIRRRSAYNIKENGEGPVSYRGGTNIDLPGPTLPEVSNGASGNEYTVNGDQTGFQNPVYETSVPTLQAVGSEPEKTGLPTNGAAGAVALPEKTGPPEGGIDASQPMPEINLPPPKEPQSFTATEDEGDTNVLVTKDKN